MVKKRETQHESAGTRIKYEIAKSPELGKYLVAAKDLVPGEVIRRDEPVVVGPAAFFQGSLCFNCLKPIALTKEKDFCCTKCNVAPLCQPSCELVSGYHKHTECELLLANQSCILNIFEHTTAILLPLRLWLIKEFQPEIWETIDQMEDHIEERRRTSVWKDRNDNVVQILQKFGLIPNNDDASNLMQRICGILDVNSFELRSLDDSSNHILRGIYTGAALMTHDCRGNTHLTVDDKHQLTIYASIFIKKGDIIYFNYTGSFLGTTERREILREGKYFECKCTLCSDPYELGSHLSSLVCPRCRKGYVTMQNPLTRNPYALKTRWQCEACKSLLSGKLIRTTLNLIRFLIDGSEAHNTKELESLLQKLLLTVHTNHYLALEVKQKLLAAYRIEISAVNPQKKVLKRLLNLCEEVMVVLDITEPGISRLKGITFYEMHLPMTLLANKSYTAGEISSSQLASLLEDAGELIQKALANLLLEPAGTPEGRLAKRALQELKVLRQNIADAKAIDTERPKWQSKRKTKVSKQEKSTRK